jgi:hypothetical protein
MSPRAIQIWFQNRRAKVGLERSERRDETRSSEPELARVVEVEERESQGSRNESQSGYLGLDSVDAVHILPSDFFRSYSPSRLFF